MEGLKADLAQGEQSSVLHLLVVIVAQGQQSSVLHLLVVVLAQGQLSSALHVLMVSPLNSGNPKLKLLKERCWEIHTMSHTFVPKTLSLCPVANVT